MRSDLLKEYINCQQIYHFFPFLFIIFREFKIQLVKNINKALNKHTWPYEQRLHHHVNVETIQQFDTKDLVRRFNKTHTELV